MPVYINRSLGDYLAGEKAAFIEGLEATDAFAQRSQGRAFVELTSDKQDAVLTAMDERQRPRDSPTPGPSLIARARLTLEGHVRRSLLRRQQEFRGLGLDPLSRGRAWPLRPTIRRWAWRSSRIIIRRTAPRRIMAINLKPVDVAVVGLGAAGGVAVLPLARAGLKVAGIEAGTWMDPAQDFKPDEIHNNVRGLVTTVPKAKKEIPTFRTSPDAKARQAAAHPMMNAVGGTSIHYHAQSWRLKPWDFKTRSETIKRYGASMLPKGSTLEDWPISYDELEPYYDIVEYEIGVSGKAGNIQGKIDPAGNVFEGPRQREYPMPPLRTCDYLDHDAQGRAVARLEAVSRARGHQFAAVSRAARRARITAIAIAAAATSGRRTRPASPPFPRRRRPRT